MTELHVHKFGGSSLADVDGYRRVAHLLLKHGYQNDLIVVSAAGKTTNRLYRIYADYKAKQDNTSQLEALFSFQHELTQAIRDSQLRKKTQECLKRDRKKLERWLIQPALTSYEQNELYSMGEVWSARLLSAVLSSYDVPSCMLDAREVLVAKESPNIQVMESLSQQRVENFLAEYSAHRIVMTGFMCANESGKTLLFGRNGSDYSATLLARLANYNQVHIWTDVHGVYSADPNRVAQAKLLPSVGRYQADRLARLGCPVLHERSLAPLKGTDIQMSVRSSFEPEHDFTLITSQAPQTSQSIMTSLSKVALICLSMEGDVQALLTKLRAQHLPPLAYWQGYHGDIELAFTLEYEPSALKFLQASSEQFSLDVVGVHKEQGLVALVSQQVASYEKRFSSLLDRSAKSLYRDQSSLVTLVPSENVNDLLQQLHRSCAVVAPELDVFMFYSVKQDHGMIQRTLERCYELAQKQGLQMNLRAVADETLSYQYSPAAKTLHSEQPWTLNQLKNMIHDVSARDVVVIDALPQAQLMDLYPYFFAKGIHVISAKSQSVASPFVFYRHLKNQIRQRRVYWQFDGCLESLGQFRTWIENTIHTQVAELAFRFTMPMMDITSLHNKNSFKRIYQSYADSSDFWDELLGKKLQRALLVVLRELGFEMELDDIHVQPLVRFQACMTEPLTSNEAFQVWQQHACLPNNFEQATWFYSASFEQKGLSIQAKVTLGNVAEHPSFADMAANESVLEVSSSDSEDVSCLKIKQPVTSNAILPVESDFRLLCQRLSHHL